MKESHTFDVEKDELKSFINRAVSAIVKKHGGVNSQECQDEVYNFAWACYMGGAFDLKPEKEHKIVVQATHNSFVVQIEMA